LKYNSIHIGIFIFALLLLLGSIFFIPDIFVNRFKTGPKFLVQSMTAIGLMVYVLIKKGKMTFPSLFYSSLIILWWIYHLHCSRWNFGNAIEFWTIISVFLLFYWFWEEIPQKYILFLLFACLGVVFSVWGIGEYMRWIPKTHEVFTMDGPFNNPAGISASIALLYPFSLYISFVSKEKNKYLGIVASFLMVGTIILCGARAAILAVMISTIISIVYFLKRREIRLSPFHYKIITFTGILLCFGLYFIKKDSADGRLLIWRCSAELVKQAPLFGHGSNGFTANYMVQQAKYFTEHPNSKFIKLSDNVKHPFNEFIKEIVNYGFIGFTFSLLLMVIPIYQSRKQHSSEIFFVRLSLLSIGICALFSYPLYYPFVQLMVIFLFAYLQSSNGESTFRILNNKFYIQSIICLNSILLASAIFQIKYEYKWNSIAKRSLAGFSEEMLSEYANLYTNCHLKKDALFLYNYGAELNFIGEYKKSNEILLECQKYMDDIELEILLADNFEKTNCMANAEDCLILASRMIPVRFFPIYRLAKLYEKNNQYERACNMARIIIKKEVKVPSTKIIVIKKEMNDLIIQYSNKPIKEKDLSSEVGKCESEKRHEIKE